MKVLVFNPKLCDGDRGCEETCAQQPVAAATGGGLVILSKLDGPPLPENLRILEDYGAFVLAQLPEGQVSALSPANVMELLPDRPPWPAGGVGMKRMRYDTSC